AGSLWTAVQSQAVANCDTSVDVTSGDSKAGFTSTGTSTPARWKVTNGITNFKVACADGSVTPDGVVVEIDGTASDVSLLKVQLTYRAGGTPPSTLSCNTGTGYNPC